MSVFFLKDISLFTWTTVGPVGLSSNSSQSLAFASSQCIYFRGRVDAYDYKKVNSKAQAKKILDKCRDKHQIQGFFLGVDHIGSSKKEDVSEIVDEHNLLLSVQD